MTFSTFLPYEMYVNFPLLNLISFEPLLCAQHLHGNLSESCYHSTQEIQCYIHVDY